jgi:hypothetical protein
MVVCKDCYIKWRLNNKNCPTCRAIINWIIIFFLF